MKKFRFVAAVTVSTYTTIMAETLEEVDGEAQDIQLVGYL